MDTQTYTFTAVVNKQGTQYRAFCLDIPADGYGPTPEAAIVALKQEVMPSLDEALPGCVRCSVLNLEVEVAYQNRPVQVYPFTAVIWPDGDWFVALNAEAGVVSQGETLEHAVAMIKEATELYLEEMPNPDYGHPQIITFELEPSKLEAVHA